MEQYNDDDMAYNYAKYKEENKIVKFIDKPSILNLIGSLKGKSIIDYGCGSGFYTRLFAKAGAKKVIGIDLSKQMLELAKRLDAEEDLDTIEYHIKNCEEIVNLKKHDVVFSSFLLVHASDRFALQRLVNSMYKSAKSGAVCCGITYNAFLKNEDYPFLRKYGFDISLNDDPKENDVRTLKISSLTIFDNYMPPSRTEEAFKNAGFINFKWVKTSLDSEYADEKDYFTDYLDHANGIMYYCEKP